MLERSTRAGETIPLTASRRKRSRRQTWLVVVDDNEFLLHSEKGELAIEKVSNVPVSVFHGPGGKLARAAATTLPEPLPETLPQPLPAEP